MAPFASTFRSWCLFIPAFSCPWRLSGSDPVAVDSSGPAPDSHTTQGQLECDYSLATPKRQSPIDDVQCTASSSESATPSNSPSGTMIPTCIKTMYHRLNSQLFKFTIFRHRPSNQVSITSLSYESENLIDILPDLTGQLSRTSQYATSFGGLSDIWKCNLKRTHGVIVVAVKSIRSQVTSAEDMKKKDRRLRRELEVWSRLKHNNVVPLYGIASDFGPFVALVCPWYEKGSLSSYLESDGKILSMVDRFKLLSDISAGLQYLHACSIVHGDLTGSNVLISSDGVAHLSDFGLSVVVVELVAASYFTSILNGTVRWIAPELLAVPDESMNIIPSTHSDIYSFGCLMFQVLTGKPPYSEYKRDAQVVVAISLGNKPLRPTHPTIIDRHWDFIQNSWSTAECRPSAEEVDAYVNEELHILRRSPSPLN